MTAHAAFKLSVAIAFTAIGLTVATMPAEADRTVFYMGKSYCRDQYSKWTVRRGHWMGFAINERIGRRQSCGWSSRVFSKRAAISQAMTRCQAMSRKHPELGYPNSCFLYDIK
jgi:hypothetical protein